MNCEVCGTPEISLYWSEKSMCFPRYFCSFKCRMIGTKLFNSVFGGVLLVIGLFGSLNNQSDSRPIFIFLLIIGFLSLLAGIYGYSESKNTYYSYNRRRTSPLYSQGQRRNVNNYYGMPYSLSPKRHRLYKDSTLDMEEKSVKIYVKELDTHLRPCCYQTYRLGEIYCPCGRAVPKKDD